MGPIKSHEPGKVENCLWLEAEEAARKLANLKCKKDSMCHYWFEGRQGNVTKNVTEVPS